jgi:hypothetical protein
MSSPSSIWSVIDSRHVSSAFVTLDVYFRGAENAARIPVEAHLVETLKAKLLIGTDFMGHEGFRLDFDAKTDSIDPDSRSPVVSAGGSEHDRFDSRPWWRRSQVSVDVAPFEV